MTESAIKNSPLVSVIINCFNGEKYLHEAIDSVLSQSYTNWEIIFWDNRSSDSSAEITKSYKEQRIKYYYAPRHTKLYEARNLAIAQANGELFAFLDCDDFWYEDKLIKQVELFKDNEVGFAYTNLHLKNENTGSLKKCFKKLESGYVFEKLIRKYNVSFSTVIISKTFWLKIPTKFNNNYNIIGDYDLVLRLSKICKASSIIEPLSYYRIHTSNESKNRKQTNQELEDWLNKNADMLGDNSTFVYQRIIMNKCIMSILSNNYLNLIKLIWKLNFLGFVKVLLLSIIPIAILKKRY